jgi:hypothetical protein
VSGPVDAVQCRLDGAKVASCLCCGNDKLDNSDAEKPQRAEQPLLLGSGVDREVDPNGLGKPSLEPAFLSLVICS